jgi:chemotaxis signal transduction protein
LAEIDNDVAANAIDLLPEEELRVCLFSMGEDLFAVPVELLTEIIITQNIFPVPTTPPHVLGVINLRGNIIPLVDIRSTLSLPRQSTPGQIAIMKIGAVIIGIVVDAVSEVVSVPLSKVLAIPSDSGGPAGASNSRFLKSIIQREGGVAALLDVERILEEIKMERYL